MVKAYVDENTFMETTELEQQGKKAKILLHYVRNFFYIFLNLNVYKVCVRCYYFGFYQHFHTCSCFYHATLVLDCCGRPYLGEGVLK